MTPRQRRFVEEYLVDLNATQAAVRAGFSERCASSQGSRLVRLPAVARAISEAQEKRAERTRVTADRVVRELAKVAFGDPRQLLSWGADGVMLRESADLSDAEAALVSEISVNKTAAGGTQRVKLHCKMNALTALGRHLGLFSGPLPASRGGEDFEADNETGDLRDRLARRIAGLAARLEAGRDSGGGQPD